MKKNKLIYLVLILFGIFIIYSCSKWFEEEYTAEAYPIWSYKSDRFDNYFSFSYYPTYKDIIVLCDKRGENHYLNGHNVNTGKRIWTLKYNKKIDQASFGTADNYCIGKYYMCYNEEDIKSIDVIDIEKGKIIHKFETDHKRQLGELFITFNNYFFITTEINSDNIFAEIFSVKDFSYKEKHKFIISDIRANLLEKNNKIYIFETSWDTIKKTNNKHYRSLYNVTDKKYEYYQKEIKGEGTNECIDIYIAMYDFNSKNVNNYYINPFKGEVINKIETFKTKGLVGIYNENEELYKDYVIGNHSSGNMVLYSKSSGKFIREIEANGFASMGIINGILYWVDLGSGRLRAYDIEAGKRIWDIESPDYHKNRGASFKTEIGIVQPQNGKKGKIIVRTWLEETVYCYEAIR